MLLFSLLKKFFPVTLAIVILAGKVNSKFCNGGHICSPPKECCPLGCCLVFTSGYHLSDYHISKTSPSMVDLPLWNHWLFWVFFSLLLFICMCACGMWKKRQFFANRWWHNRNIRNEEERSELNSTGSYYPPPQYSRCSSFHFAPPPYTEVTSKPDLYPLVISYRPDNGKLGDNCLMVQYFRNYVVHPALDGSTVNSFTSGFFGQSMHEPDSSLPPTYEESRIEERSQADHDPSTARTTPSDQQNYFASQKKVLKNSNCESFLGTSSAIQNDEIHQVVIENIQQSIQKACSTVVAPKLKPALSATFKNFKITQNSAQSLPSNLSSDPLLIKKKIIRPSNLYLHTFQRMNKSITISSCEDSLNENNNYEAHQYSSDVILAQPRSYCESSNELHYHSSDILNRLNHCLHNANNSYSSEDNLSQPRGSLQDFVSSDGLSHSQLSNLEVNNFSTSSDVSSLQGCGSPDSPPKATSPTGEFRNLLDKIQLLPIHKYSIKFSDPDDLEFLTTDIKSAQIPESPNSGNVINDNIEISERESSVEKSCLLNEFTQLAFKPKLKKSTPIRPKMLYKENFPSRSKTFNMLFSQNSTKRKANFKSSKSAPVTPVTNLPSPGSIALSFATNGTKFGSKKNIKNKGDSRPLLQNEDENQDEVF